MQRMKKIILASASQERARILKKAGFQFSVQPGKVYEDLSLKLRPRTLAKRLAHQKARDVASLYKKGIVIGADTIVVLRGKIIGKPRTKRHAQAILSSLSGKTHSVITGFCVIDAQSGHSRCRSVESKVMFRTLSIGEIRAYTAKRESMRAAGAYSIRGGGKSFVRSVRGDYLNIAGLPLGALKRALEEIKTR